MAQAGSPTRFTTMLALALLAAGCSSPIEPNETVWEAEIRPVAGTSLISGSAGAISDRHRRRTTAGIRIDGAPSGLALPWRIRSGRCGGPRGDILGAQVSYPDIMPDATGSDVRDAVLTQPMTASDSYVVEVWRGPADDEVLACGALRRI
jgi:hypothetical protein